MKQPRRVLPIIGAALLVLVGLALLAAALGGSGSGTGIFGVLTLGLGVLSALRQASTATGRQIISLVPTATLAGPHGPEPALVLVSARRDLLVTCLSLALVAACAAAGAVSAFAAGAAVLGVVLVVVAAATAVTLIGPVRARGRATTLELTPTRLITTHHGARWALSWSDISGVVPVSGPATPAALVLYATASPTRTRGWPGWTRPSKASDGIVGLTIHGLGVHPRLLTRVIALCATDAALRAQLGSPASTDWSTWPPNQKPPTRTPPTQTPPRGNY